MTGVRRGGVVRRRLAEILDLFAGAEPARSEQIAEVLGAGDEFGSISGADAETLLDGERPRA